MSDYLVKSGTLVDIANAIRLKTNKEESIPLNQFSNEIRNITSSSGSVETVTATINFGAPYQEYVFIYEDGDGEVNKFETYADTDYDIEFNIRKDSIVVFHCEDFAQGIIFGVGLFPEALGSGIPNFEIIQLTLNDNNQIIDMIGKVTGDFCISWNDEILEEPEL